MELYDFTCGLVRRAGALLLEEKEKGFKTMEKGGDPRDLVTSVDLVVNHFITKEIQEKYPEHAIYSEEEKIEFEEKKCLWAVDPIDGTSLFSRNIPHFAVCVGVLEGGVPIVGAVYNPATEELFSFEKGRGAFLNGERITTSSITELADSFVFFAAGRKRELAEWSGESYKRLLLNVKKVKNFGSSSLDICFVASGRIEGAVYGTLSTLDIAAAIGILHEVGGVAVTQDGSDLEFLSTSQRIFFANNRATADQLRETLSE